MALIQRKWSPLSAEEWTKEDWIAMVISPVAYVLIMVGVALSFFLLWYGFVLLGGGIVSTILMHWVIDPKLKVISEEYEARQKEYLQELERLVRWEQTNE